jgi:hypothetical protein
MMFGSRRANQNCFGNYLVELRHQGKGAEILMASNDDRQCPFCPFKSHAEENYKGTINRHIKREAKKPVESRIAGHPAEDSDKYRHVMFARGCFNRAKDEDEKDQRRAASQARYRIKAKIANEALLNKKIQDAFHALEYISFNIDLILI